MLMMVITWPPFTYTMFSFLLFNVISIRISSQPPIVHCVYISICACIFFLLISFLLWLVLVFLFSRVYYGFTPLWHWMSRHYVSQQMDEDHQISFKKQKNDFILSTCVYSMTWFSSSTMSMTILKVP